MSASLLESDDLTGYAAGKVGNQILAQALQSIDDDATLFRLIANYIAFNATFGACVANLAGELGVRQDLFRDPTEEVAALADRSMEIASDILYAAIDEFDDRSTSHRDTHRTLASATLKATAEYLKLDHETLNRLATPAETTLAALPKVRHGYGVNRGLEDRDLFEALGFHVASEVLADGEFNLLNDHLRTHYPDLVSHLETAKVAINGEEHLAYWWIYIHTSVEADHFDFAVRGLNSAMSYYTGSESFETLRQWILTGFDRFAEVQENFMTGLTRL